VLADQADLRRSRELADESRKGSVRVPNPFNKAQTTQGPICNGCVNVGLSTVPSTSLTQSQ
jgi:hypothetical protein